MEWVIAGLVLLTVVLGAVGVYECNKEGRTTKWD